MAINNPYIPGDPYSYDLKWIVAKVKEILAQLGTLDEAIEAKIFEGFLEHSIVQFKTVPEMLAADIKDGSIVLTLGYHEAGDQGGLFYLVKDFNPSQCALDYFLTLDNNRQIAIPIIVTPYVTPEMFGAYGDGTTDDTQAAQEALKIGKTVLFPSASYRILSLTLTGDQVIRGRQETTGATVLKCRDGITLVGKRNVVKYLEIIGDNPRESATGKGITFNHTGSGSYMCMLKGVNVLQYEYGIYIDSLLWDSRMQDVKVQFCKTGMINVNHNVHFEANNMFFSGNITQNMKLSNAQVVFNYCNFGFSVANNNIEMTPNDDIVFESCNFECDKYIDEAGALVAITGYHASFRNCLFRVTIGPTRYVMQTGAACQGVEFINCRYIDVSIGGQANQAYGFFEKTTTNKAVRYGAIKLIGCDSFPNQLDAANTNGKLANSAFPYFFDDRVGAIQTYQQGYLDPAIMTPGMKVWVQSSAKYVLYNGSAIVDL